MPGAEMWRVLGDEIIFIVPIRETKDFYEYVSNIFGILNTMVYQLKKGEFFDDISVSDSERQLMKMQNIISLKAAAWIAIIGEGIEKLEQYDNLLERYKLREGYGIFEFLGNDIDAGFRIKKETQDRRLTISFELAYLLSKDTDYLKNIHIITYKKEKGIWHDRLYPVIWYHDPKIVNGILFENSFYYDEEESCLLVKEYFINRKEPKLSLEMYEDVYTALRKVLKDQGLEDKLNKINEIIKESQESSKREGNLLEPNFLLKLHCVAVCYDTKAKKILIMKRAEDRDKLPGHWEFGCAKGTLENTLIDQIQQEYMKDFNIDIKIVCDNEREEKQPIPLAIYEIGGDKGIIVLAEIAQEYDINNFHGKKHCELRWISEDEVEEFDEKSVKDFKNTLKLAFKKMGEIDGNN